MWQATRFMMSKLKGFKVTSDELIEDVVAFLQPRDKWILNCLNEACIACDTGFVNYNYAQATQAAYDFFLKQLCDVYIELTKPIFQRNDEIPADITPPSQREVTMRVLWTCLDRAMRLFHPFMPYVTEELWQRLPGRGLIPEEPPSIMLTKYPKAQKCWAYPETVAAMNLVLACAGSLRSLVQPYGLKSSTNAKVYLTSQSAESAVYLTQQSGDITALVMGIGSIEVLDGSQEPVGCGVCQVNSEVSGYVELKGLIDIPKELKKKEKKIKQLEKMVSKYVNVIKNGQGKMGQDIIDKKTAQLEDYRKELEGQIKQMQTLKSMQ
jgi:valyl-tRNA synthetase